MPYSFSMQRSNVLLRFDLNISILLKEFPFLERFEHAARLGSIETAARGRIGPPRDNAQTTTRAVRELDANTVCRLD